MAIKKIALFIDADNISAKFGKQIIETLESRGEIFIRRIYGNWEKNFLHSWNECILNFSLRAVQQPDFVTGKNATDMCLTIDAMDVLHAGKADTFALVSNDSDFTPLVIRLREGGVNIIGIGNSCASNAFRAACNEFIDMDAPSKSSEVKEQVEEKKISPATLKVPEKKISPAQLSLFDTENPVAPKSESSPKKSSSSKVVPITVQDDAQDKLRILHDILQEAAQLHGDANGFTAMCWAGQGISRQNLGFGVKDFGYGSLHKFVSDFPDLYEVIQRDNGENFCYRCRVLKPTKSTVAEKSIAPDNDANLQKMHDALRVAVTFHANDDGFANLCSVGSYVTKKIKFGVKNLGYNSLQKFLDAFPNLYDVRKDGHQVFLRCHVDETPNLSADNGVDKLHDLLRQTAEARADETGFTDLSYVGNSLGKQKIGFGIRDLGYGTLQKFVADFPDRYELRKTLKKIFYRCRDVKSNGALNDDKLRQLHDILRESANLHADADGFSPINYAGQEIKNKHLGFGIRNFGYSQLREFVSDFPDLYEISHDASGRKFRYRCKRV